MRDYSRHMLGMKWCRSKGACGFYLSLNFWPGFESGMDINHVVFSMDDFCTILFWGQSIFKGGKY